MVELLESKCFKGAYEKVDEVYKTRVLCVKKNIQHLADRILHDDHLAITSDIVRLMLVPDGEKGGHQINPQRLTQAHQEFRRMVDTIDGRLRHSKAKGRTREETRVKDKAPVAKPESTAYPT